MKKTNSDWTGTADLSIYIPAPYPYSTHMPPRRDENQQVDVASGLCLFPDIGNTFE